MNEWHTVKLETIADVIDSLHQTPKYSDTGYPMVRVTDIKKGPLNLSNTLRVTKCFWALDAKLAQRRHFPSINWLTSYTLYNKILENWYATNVNPRWSAVMARMMTILQEEEKLLEIVQLVGSDALPEKQQLTLEIARMIREFFLQQNAYHDIDTYCEPKKTFMLADTILYFGDKAYSALDEGVSIITVLNLSSKERVADVKFIKDYETELNKIKLEMDREFSNIDA